MRRRNDEKPPAELLTFNGHPYKTYGDWAVAFDAFIEARERWCADRGLADHALPIFKIDGDQPWRGLSV